jgi:hypothetical protein
LAEKWKIFKIKAEKWKISDGSLKIFLDDKKTF